MASVASGVAGLGRRCAAAISAIAGVLGLVGVFGVALLSIGVEPAAAAPFGCTNGLIYSTATAGVKILQPDGSISNFPVTGTAPNSLAYNPVDGNLYGLPSNSNVINVIQADGTQTSVGTITGLPNQNYFAATFATDGTLYLASSTGGTTTLYTVNLTTLTATSVVASTTFNVDLVWINGTLYALKGTALATINPTTGQVTTTSSITGLGGIVGAMWFTDGHLFVQGGTGTNAVLQVHEVLNYQSAAPTQTLATTLTGSSPTDGASCPTARSPFISAADDDFSSAPVAQDTGGAVGNVFPNDTVGAATATNILATATVVDTGGAAGATIAADGTLTVPGGTPAGTYALTYQLCETANPALCDSAIATFVVAPVVDTSVINPEVAAGAGLTVLIAAGFVLYRRRRTA